MTDVSTPLHPQSNFTEKEIELEKDLSHDVRSSNQAGYHGNSALSYTASEESICARCRSLDRTSLSGPPFSLVAPYIHGNDSALSDVKSTLHQFMKHSLQPECYICTQLLQLLHVHSERPDRLRIWWNSYRVYPGGNYVHTCRLDDGQGYHDDLDLIPLVKAGTKTLDEDDEKPGIVSHGENLDFKRIRRWLRLCQQNHRICAMPRNQNTTSLRVIDCRARELTMIAPACPYVALSYVWGKREPASPSTSLLFPTRLPKTIEDAMIVTLGLGLEYLWVDRYCINQDDDEEKERLFSSMDLIYRNAEITVIAAAGEGPEEGLPGIRGSPRVGMKRVQIGAHTFLAISNHHTEIGASKWRSRGWTYQEGCLSRRQLVFLKSQLYFQCSSYIFKEGHHDTLPPSSLQQPELQTRAYDILALFPLPNYNTQPEPGGLPWKLRTDLHAYYQKELSYQSDTLRAFQGIVNFYRHHAQLDGVLAHFWGLNIISLGYLDARAAFIAELQWSVSSRSGYLMLAPAQPDSSDSVFPSWSWAVKMAQDMASQRSQLKHQHREYSDPYDPASVLKYCDEISIIFTHKSGEEMSLGDYMMQTDSYLSFHPWFEIDCWSIRGCIKAGIPLDRYEPFHEPDLDRLGYEELDLDYRVEWARAEKSVFVIFLGAWEHTGHKATEDGGDHVRESDSNSSSDDDVSDYSDARCILAEQVDPGIYRRIGLWSVGTARGGEDWDTERVLRRLLRGRVISSDEQWKRRRIRLI